MFTAFHAGDTGSNPVGDAINLLIKVNSYLATCNWVGLLVEAEGSARRPFLLESTLRVERNSFSWCR